MSLIRDLAIGAIGYGVSEFTRDNEKVLDQPLASLIEDWCKRKGIYGRNNEVSRELAKLSEYYKDPYAY